MSSKETGRDELIAAPPRADEAVRITLERCERIAAKLADEVNSSAWRGAYRAFESAIRREIISPALALPAQEGVQTRPQIESSRAAENVPLSDPLWKRCRARRLDTKHRNRWEAQCDKRPVGRAPTEYAALQIAMAHAQLSPDAIAPENPSLQVEPKSSEPPLPAPPSPGERTP